MKPLFVRELSDPERHALQAGLRSSDGFTVRRRHILLASARGDTAPVIAQAVGCSPQAVRNVLRAFESRGLAVVAMQSRRPHTAAKVFDAERRPAGSHVTAAWSVWMLVRHQRTLFDWRLCGIC